MFSIIIQDLKTMRLKSLFVKLLSKIKNNPKHGEDYIYLMLIQGTSYIFPLISLPYLSRVLGPEKLGILGFAQAVVLYFILVVDYSFNQTATKFISQYKDNKKRVTKYVWDVTFARLILGGLCFLFLVLLIILFSKFRSEYVIHLISYASVFGHIFFPVWYFQGTQQLKKVSIINFIIRTLSFALMFILVQHERDYYFVQISSSIGILIGSIVAMYMVCKQIGFVYPSVHRALRLIKKNFAFFITQVITSFYTYINVLLLGLLTTDTEVGYYSIVEKFMNAVKSIYFNYSQVVFPLMSARYKKDKLRSEKFTFKLIILISSLMFCIGIIIFIFARPIVLILFGEQYTNSIVLLRISSMTPFIISVGNLLILDFAFLREKKRFYLLITIVAGLTNIVLSITLVPYIRSIGTNISNLVSELIITLGFIIVAIGYYRRKHLNNLNKKI